MSRMSKGTAALEEWAKKATDGYRGVSVQNMTKSWRNGLAFCALIHRYHPDLIDFDSLDPSDIIGNCSLAFEVAESKLGIPALLDPEDMLANEVPDRLSILTYVAQYYNALKNSSKKSNVTSSELSNDENEGLPNGNHSVKVGTKRIMDSDDIIESTRDRTPKRPVLLSSSTVCTVCRNPVYILERVLFTKKLYHRSCFRCSNCDSVLNPQTADISPDGRLFCLENDCHRKLQLLSRKMSTSTPPTIKPLEKQKEVAISSSVTASQVGAKPSGILNTASKIPDLVDAEKQAQKVLEDKPPSSLTKNSKYQSIIQFFSEPVDSHTVADKVEVVQNHQSKVKEAPSDSSHWDAKKKLFNSVSAHKHPEKVEVVQNHQSTVKDEPSDSSHWDAKKKLFNSVSAHKHPEKVSAALGHQQHVKEDREGIVDPSAKEQSDNPFETEPEAEKAVKHGKHQQPMEVEPSDILHTKASTKEHTDNPFEMKEEPEKQPTKQDTATILHNNIKEQSISPVKLQKKPDKFVKIEDPSDILHVNPTEQSVSPVKLQKKPDKFVKIEDPSDILHVNPTEQLDSPLELNKNPNKVLKQIERKQRIKEGVVQDNRTEVYPKDVSSQVEAKNDDISINPNIEQCVHDLSKNKNESKSAEPLEKVDDELPNDRVNVEVVNNSPVDAEKTRAVSFSSIVEVAKIEAVSSNEEIIAKTAPLTIPANSNEGNSIVPEIDETEKSPKTKPKTAFEFIKDNVEPLSGNSEPIEDDMNVHGNLLPEDMLRIQTTDTEENQLELASHNESGVGDSLQSDIKSETDSVNISIGDSKDKISSAHDYNCDDHNVNGSVNEIEDQSSTSLVLSGGEGESNENQTPRRLPRLPRSTSPSLDRSPAPTPTPRKRTSGREQGHKKDEVASELWKTKDYYPAELNPFESEDTFTLQPSDILVIKKTSSHERLPPLNPFEEDEDEDPNAPVVPVNSPQVIPTPPPKSPAHSIYSTRSAESVNGSVRARSRKSHHAPLPPSMMTPKKTVISPYSNTRDKGPAPPPPVQTLSQPVTNSGSPEKKLIPASPDLLKGLKNQANKATAQQYRKKRRAPPPKRFVTPLPEATIKTELADLNIKEKELERQGISLEANIRRLMAQEDDSHEEQIDEMVIQLWNIVNEKNDILRRQTELDYLRRGHRLEEIQAEVEFQLRVLMETPAEQRQPGHEEAEQQLLDELLKIVDERNEVVDWLDFHRQIDREEDLHVSQSLTSFATLSRSSTPTPTQVVLPIKSETVTEESKNATVKGKTKDKIKEDGKSNKKERFKIGFFTKKKKTSKSKKQDEDKDKDESLKVA